MPLPVLHISCSQEAEINPNATCGIGPGLSSVNDIKKDEIWSQGLLAFCYSNKKQTNKKNPQNPIQNSLKMCPTLNHNDPEATGIMLKVQLPAHLVLAEVLVLHFACSITPLKAISPAQDPF